MGMYDTGEIDLILPSGSRYHIGSDRGSELQCSIACMMMHFHVTNLGTQGYSRNDPYNPFSLMRDEYIQFTYGDDTLNRFVDIRVHFNWIGVVHKIGIVNWNKKSSQWEEDEKLTVSWPKDQIRKYNLKALYEIIKLQPSRFKKEVSTWTRIRCAFHFMVYLKIMDLYTKITRDESHSKK